MQSWPAHWTQGDDPTICPTEKVPTTLPRTHAQYPLLEGYFRAHHEVTLSEQAVQLKRTFNRTVCYSACCAFISVLSATRLYLFSFPFYTLQTKLLYEMFDQ